MNLLARQVSRLKSNCHRGDSSRVVAPITQPEKSLADCGIALGVFTFSCLYLWIFRDSIFWQQDEGIVLQGAVRILHGQVLYRDFFAYYTPGSYYWMAVLFRLFGTSILVARTALMVYGGVYSSVSYLLARRVASRASSLLVALLVILISVPQLFIALHNWDSTLWACLALYCAVRVLEGGNELWVFSTGTFTAITCLFEQSKGAGLALGLGVGFLALHSRKGQDLRSWKPANIAALVMGFCCPFGGTILYFGRSHALMDMLKALWWPFIHYSAVAHVPYGYVSWWDTAVDMVIHGSWGLRFVAMLSFGPYVAPAFLPLVMVGVFGFRAYQLHENPTAGLKTEYYVLVSAVGSGLLTSLVATHRADLMHLTFLAPITFLPVAWIFGKRDIASTHSGSLYPLLFLWILLSAAVCGTALLSPCLAARTTIRTRRGTLKSIASDEVIPFIQQHVLPGQKLLAYPHLTLYYFLTDTYNVSRYEWMQPGLQDLGEFNDVRTSLEQSRPEVVIFSPNASESLGASYPFTPLKDLAAKDPVADYVLKHYRPCVVLRSGGEDRVVFMVRNNLSCPKAPAAGAEHANSGTN